MDEEDSFNLKEKRSTSTSEGTVLEEY